MADALKAKLNLGSLASLKADLAKLRANKPKAAAPDASAKTLDGGPGIGATAVNSSGGGPGSTVNTANLNRSSSTHVAGALAKAAGMQSSANPASGPGGSSYSFVPGNNKFSLVAGDDPSGHVLTDIHDDPELGDPHAPYDPTRPNNYDEVVRRRRRREQELALKRHEMEAERRRQAELENSKARQAAQEDDPALAYMKRMGWKEGQGLGKDGSGIAAPLIMRKTDASAGTIAMGTAMPAATAPPSTGAGAPSAVILLLNVVARGDTDDELRDEMVEEAGKYGKVLDCKIVEMPPPIPDNEAVRIYIQYSNIQEGAMARSKFSGRKFGANKVSCFYFDEGKFKRGDLRG